jgi:hypothetical protein
VWVGYQYDYQTCIEFCYQGREIDLKHASIGGTVTSSGHIPDGVVPRRYLPDGYGGVLVNWGFNSEWLSSPTEDWNLSLAYPYGGYVLGALPDSIDDRFVLWAEISATEYESTDLVATRLHGGSYRPGWTVPYNPICMATGDQSRGGLASDTRGGFVAAWQDTRDGTPQLYGLHVSGMAQHPSGTTDGQLLCVAPGTRNGPILLPSIGPTALVIWQDTRNDAGDIYAQRLGWDAPTAVAAALLSSETAPDRVTLRWYSPTTHALELQRAIGSGAWADLARLTPDGEGVLGYVDRDVHPGEALHYRLLDPADHQAIGGTEASVTIPAAWTLALAGSVPNPSQSTLKIAFTLPDAAPATLDVFDVSGRRVASRAVGALGAGPQLVAFDRELRASGIYLVRLTRGTRALTTRAILVR